MTNCRLNINLREITSLPKMIKDYIDGNLKDFHGLVFNKENALYQANRKAQNYPKKHRQILVEILVKQMKEVTISTEQMKNIELLKLDNTFTITTGHQLNLFTGPVFFIYKILQTIKTAKFLNENKEGKNFVPVFWMASEDHDFEEINHFNTQNNFHQIHEKAGNAVGRIKLSDNFFLENLEKEFKDFSYGTELIRWAKEAYTTGISLTLATRILVNRIFSNYGLLILNADDKKLKKIAISKFKNELLNQNLQKKSNNSVKELVERYRKVQVNPREINLFYLNNNQRSRIEKVNYKYKIVGSNTIFSKEEILEELNSFPERFSPNALMRPLYQETILPNIVYIGGNAEIMYWLELKEFFQSENVEFPIIIPRNSITFISEKIVNKINKLNLCIKDFFDDYHSIVHKKFLEKSPILPILNKKKEELKTLFTEIKIHAQKTDKTFLNLVNAEETRQLKSFNRMEKRLVRAEKIFHGDLYQRYYRLYETVNPDGIWQERKINFSDFYAQDGINWLNICYECIDVTTPKLSVIVL